jgi:hypothetical protein
MNGKKRRHQSLCAESFDKPQSVTVACPAFSSQKFEKGDALACSILRPVCLAKNERLEKSRLKA